MKIFLLDQKKELSKHLEYLKKYEVAPYKKSDLKYKASIVEIPVNNNFSDIDFTHFFNYKIFPSSILTSYSQWQKEERKMEISDTIVQQIYFPPLKIFSQKIIVGVRINEILDTEFCKGFSYETLKGHIEKGISQFKIEKNETHLTFSIKTFSNIQNPLLCPIKLIASMYQSYCTQQALKQVKQNLSIRTPFRFDPKIK